VVGLESKGERPRDESRLPSLNGVSCESSGHRPGNLIPKNRCVLKERRIGRAGSISDTRRLCGVPSEREECCRVNPQGCTLGWYARPLQGRYPTESDQCSTGKLTSRWPGTLAPVSTTGPQATSLKTRLRNRFFASASIPKRRSERRSAPPL
jgi:hypothetical protein